MRVVAQIVAATPMVFSPDTENGAGTGVPRLFLFLPPQPVLMHPRAFWLISMVTAFPMHIGAVCHSFVAWMIREVLPTPNGRTHIVGGRGGIGQPGKRKDKLAGREFPLTHNLISRDVLLRFA